MKKHQLIFENFKEVFKKHFKDKVIISIETHGEYSTEHLKITGTNIWLSCNEDELELGFKEGIHKYCDSNNNPNIFEDNVFDFIELLTKPRRVIHHFKGKKCFKTEIYTKNKNEDWVKFGMTTSLKHPFWKKTIQEISIEEPLIDSKNFIRDVNKIKNLI